MKDAFLVYLPFGDWENFTSTCVPSKRKEGVSWTYGTPFYLISIKYFICSLHQ